MQLDDFVYTLGRHMRVRHGGRVRKLAIDGHFTCPNRDGTLGRGGCTFCSIDSFAEPQSAISIAAQVAHRKAEIKQKNIRYLAYFQAYTNTHAELGYLRSLYSEALSQPDVIGLCVGTRPDCLPEPVLQFLAEVQSQGKDVWIELGLQSAHDRTLKKINRGHDFACYQQAVARCRQWGLPVCCHLIVGLPGEQLEDYRVTLQRVVETGVDGLKLHPLHIVKNSAMARTWRGGRLTPLTQDAYVAAVVGLIQHTPADIVFHRVSAQARPGTLLAPEWCGNKWQPIVEITRQLSVHGGQGSALWAT